MTARSSSPLGVGSGDTLSMQDPGQGKTQSRSSSQAGLLAPGSVLWLLYRQDVLNSPRDSREVWSLSSGPGSHPARCRLSSAFREVGL